LSNQFIWLCKKKGIKRLREIEVRLIDVNSFSRYSAEISSEGLTVEEVKLWKNW